MIFGLAALTLAGCTSAGTTAPSSAGSTVTSTATATRTNDTGTEYQPPKASYAPRLSAGGDVPDGEKKGRCPYIRAGKDEDPTSEPNVADIGGSRVKLTTTLPAYTPVGCRFYYEYGRDAVADILPTTFATALQARNAMIRTGEAGKQTSGVPGIAPGVDGVSYRTRFERGDGDNDWAFAFAEGKVMVVVHTRETRASFNAVNLAKAIVAEF